MDVPVLFALLKGRVPLYCTVLTMNNHYFFIEMKVYSINRILSRDFIQYHIGLNRVIMML